MKKQFLLLSFGLMLVNTAHAGPTENCKAAALKAASLLYAAQFPNDKAGRDYETPFINKTVIGFNSDNEKVENAAVWIVRHTKNQLLDTYTYSVDFDAEKACVIKSILDTGRVQI